jgi:hypothetical protein
MMLSLKINSRSVMIFLLCAYLIVLEMHLMLFPACYGGWRSPEALMLFKFFDLNREVNIPTWFSSMLLFSASSLCVVIGARLKRVQWFALAGIFAYLSLDEFVTIHEAVGNAIHRAFQTTGYFSNAWVIVAIPLIILFAIVFRKFFIDLPAKVRSALLAAFALYVFGAVGMDMIVGQMVTLGSSVILVCIEAFLEEAMEMGAVLLIIDVLFRYLGIIGKQR